MSRYLWIWSPNKENQLNNNNFFFFFGKIRLTSTKVWGNERLPKTCKIKNILHQTLCWCNSIKDWGALKKLVIPFYKLLIDIL